MLEKKEYNFLQYLIKIVPKYLYKNLDYKLNEKTIIVKVNKDNLIPLVNFFKNHWMLQYKTLIAITAVDYPNEVNRFKVSYFLLSYKLNNRIIITVDTSENEPINSITSIYKGANWYEREVWDLFGVFFLGHPDLRRILTDYGFEGYPFRKDFPQTGFTEVRYDDEKKHVLYEPVEMSQEYRFFNYINPWSNIK